MTATTTSPELTPRPVPRLDETLSRLVPDAEERKRALHVLARAIDETDQARDDGWYLRVTSRNLGLYAGRLYALGISRGKVHMSVLGSVADEVRAELGSDPDDDSLWDAVEGARCITFHVEKAELGYERLGGAFSRFVAEASARVRRRVRLDNHSPEALAFLAAAVGRSLPSPSENVPDAPTSDPSLDADDDDVEDARPTNRTPQVRGRAPVFEHAQKPISSLLEAVDEGTMALPDLQRPFVWEDRKVRDLLDSLFLGYPVGTLVFWHTPEGRDARGVGTARALRATTLVIDGQQRLTSLYAVMRGAEVIDKEGRRRRIRIAFRPRDGRFAVADAAILRDPEWLPDVAEVWDTKVLLSARRRKLLEAARSKPGLLVDELYESAVEENLGRLQALASYPFPVVTLRNPGAGTGSESFEEDVADVFVRINNQGKRLGNADFVLTLLAVYHGDLRDRTEQSARELSKQAIVPIDTQQLLRASCAVGFRRGTMSAMYRFLRGVDPATGTADEETRKERLATLERAAEACMHRGTWADYMLRVMHGGIVSDALVSSNAVIHNGYALYVLGRRAGVPKAELDRLLSRWIFATQLAARYSQSSESRFDEDLARLPKDVDANPEAFLHALDDAIAEFVAGDFWTVTLLRALETQHWRSPAALGFRAAQVVLGARALFSDQPVQNLLAPPGKGARSAAETHHLFPHAWLAKRGIKDRKRVNQIANLADVGWHENASIGAQGPAEYVPRLREELGLDDDRWGRMCAEHALPPGWETMEYETFLRERRPRMAEVTRAAFRLLGGEQHAPPRTPPWFLPGAEHVWKRIAETERALRAVVRAVYQERHGDGAAAKIEGAIPEKERETLTRALRARPAGGDPLGILDYTYLAQLPPLLFHNDVWQLARQKLQGANDVKAKLNEAIGHIAKVRNDIAHVREVPMDRLKRADVACDDVLGIVGRSS